MTWPNFHFSWETRLLVDGSKQIASIWIKSSTVQTENFFYTYHLFNRHYLAVAIRSSFVSFFFIRDLPSLTQKLPSSLTWSRHMQSHTCKESRITTSSRLGLFKMHNYHVHVIKHWGGVDDLRHKHFIFMLFMINVKMTFDGSTPIAKKVAQANIALVAFFRIKHFRYQQHTA